MKNVKDYDLEYMNIVENTDKSISRRQIHRQIARKWNVPYSEVVAFGNESDELYKTYKSKDNEET